jgi:hypothetical protein
VLDSKFSQDSLKTPELKLVLILASLATKFLFARLASLVTKFVSETREKRVLLQNFFLRDSLFATLATKFLSVRLTRSESPTNFDSRVLQKSCENFGSKKRVSLSREFQKVILESTLVRTCLHPSPTHPVPSPAPPPPFHTYGSSVLSFSPTCICIHLALLAASLP